MEFKKVTPTVEAPLQPGPVQPTPQPIESNSNDVARDPIERLDVYETERGKYALKYFGVKEIAAEDFKVKMDVSRVDKYIKDQMQSKEYDYTLTNYNKILSELESNINSTMLSPQKRLQRIINYISVMQKMQKLEEQKKAFFS